MPECNIIDALFCTMAKQVSTLVVQELQAAHDVVRTSREGIISID